MNYFNQFVKDTILKTNGKIFRIIFIKADKSQRKMLARLGVKKGLTGTGRTKPLDDHLITVWDIENKGYRTIDTSRVLSMKCGSLTIGSDKTA